VTIVFGGGSHARGTAHLHLLRRAGYSEQFVAEVARVMEYSKAYDLYRGDVETSA
jgi:hypothetical protein